MNELIFFSHTAVMFLLTLGALRMGKLALFTWICLQALLANLFVLKQIMLFGFHVTASDVFAVGGILGLNLLQEYYGTQISKKAIATSFYFMMVFALLSQIHLFYTPSSADETHAAYTTIFSAAPRLLLASFCVFWLVQQVDVKIFSKLKKINLPFTLRIFLSLCLSQLLDTILFTYIGLYGLIHSCFDVILVSFLIKLIVIAFYTQAAHLAKRYIPVKDQNT